MKLSSDKTMTHVCWAGVGASQQVIVQSGDQSSTDNVNFKYFGPAITSINPNEGPTAGGIKLTIFGSNFGTSGSVTVANAPCYPGVNEYGHSRIECTMSQGTGINQEVRTHGCACCSMQTLMCWCAMHGALGSGDCSRSDKRSKLVFF